MRNLKRLAAAAILLGGLTACAGTGSCTGPICTGTNAQGQPTPANCSVGGC
jgi:hypothetical protein